MPDEPSSVLERKLATILSADVAGYSRLMAENEEETLRIFRGHRQVFESLVAMHRGRIFNTAGDAILAEFPSAVEAVRCATEIQTALHTRNDQLPTARQVKLRIGVNLGDVMVQGGDLLGDGVNVASRLQAAAEPGGICISGSVYDQIRNKLSLSFKSLGERSFKNIPRPVRTFSITETEDHSALPSHTADARKIFKWATLATLLVLIAGGGTWGYVRYQNGIERSGARRASRSSAPKPVPRLKKKLPATRRPRASLSLPANRQRPTRAGGTWRRAASRRCSGSAKHAAGPGACLPRSQGRPLQLSRRPRHRLATRPARQIPAASSQWTECMQGRFAWAKLVSRQPAAIGRRLP